MYALLVAQVVAIVEARMSSKRLPGKVLMEVAGVPLLGHLVNRLRVVKLLDNIVIATTVNQSDDVIEKFAIEYGVSCYRGSEDDVMSRVLDAARSVDAEIVCEITGDCPLVDPEIVDQMLEIFCSNNVDYLSNANIRSYPDGMDVQVFRTSVLERSANITSNLLDREHVTLHIRKNVGLFSRINVIAPLELRWPELGLTLDEMSDFVLIKTIIEDLSIQNQLFGCGEIIKYLKSKPHLISINNAVVRRGDS